MSAAQAMASQQFLDAMGPMIYDERQVTRVVSLIDYMRRNEAQLPLITEEELQDSMPLDVAMNKLREHIHARFETRV